MDKELGWFTLACQIDGDGLADTVNAVDAGAGEGFGYLRQRRPKGLRILVQPYIDDSLSMGALVDAVGYGLYFGELGNAS